MLKGYLIKLDAEILGEVPEYLGPKAGVIYKTKAKPEAWLKKWGGHGKVVAVTVLETGAAESIRRDR